MFVIRMVLVLLLVYLKTMRVLSRAKHIVDSCDDPTTINVKFASDISVVLVSTSLKETPCGKDISPKIHNIVGVFRFPRSSSFDCMKEGKSIPPIDLLGGVEEKEKEDAGDGDASTNVEFTSKNSRLVSSHFCSSKASKIRAQVKIYDFGSPSIGSQYERKGP